MELSSTGCQCSPERKSDMLKKDHLPHYTATLLAPDRDVNLLYTTLFYDYKTQNPYSTILHPAAYWLVIKRTDTHIQERSTDQTWTKTREQTQQQTQRRQPGCAQGRTFNMPFQQVSSATQRAEKRAECLPRHRHLAGDTLPAQYFALSYGFVQTTAMMSQIKELFPPQTLDKPHQLHTLPPASCSSQHLSGSFLILSQINWLSQRTQGKLKKKLTKPNLVQTRRRFLLSNFQTAAFWFFCSPWTRNKGLIVCWGQMAKCAHDHRSAHIPLH